MPRLHFAEADVSAEKARLAVRCEKGTLRMTMREFVCSRCPSLLKEFKPSKVLFKLVVYFYFLSLESILTDASGHLQTAYGAYGDFSNVDRIMYDRWAIFPS